MPDFKCEKCGKTGWLPRIEENELYRCQGCSTLLGFKLPEAAYRGVQVHDPYCPPCDCSACVRPAKPEDREATPCPRCQGGVPCSTCHGAGRVVAVAQDNKDTP